jgi:CXXX repeat radical SAM target protein
MAKRKVQPVVKADPDTSIDSTKTMDRRAFVKNMAKAAIPTIALLGLARPRDLAAKTPRKPQELDKGYAKGPNDCVLTCEGGCRGCEGECLGTCKDACFLTCEGSCKYTCEGGCTGSCEGMCKGSCGGACSSTAW